MKYLLDTHAWIWWHVAPERLSASAAAIIDAPDADDELLLSAISPWEFSKLLEKGRLAVSTDPEAWIEKALTLPGLGLVPLTPRIAYRSTVLPQPFHRDPGDQILVATARDLDAVLITKDERLREYPHVKTLW
jgi:PIN domain nuclease of toxin-antitoxin system